MRAFIEGDFAGRAIACPAPRYGQWRRLDYGTDMVDLLGSRGGTDGIDFEGLNAIVLFRQTQIRWRLRSRSAGGWHSPGRPASRFDRRQGGKPGAQTSLPGFVGTTDRGSRAAGRHRPQLVGEAEGGPSEIVAAGGYGVSSAADSP